MSEETVELNRPVLIAPCGINCRLCRAYGRKRDACPGCRPGQRSECDNAVHCSVHCPQLASGTVQYCFQCGDFPCPRLLHLDRRYRTRYGTSPLDNLAFIDANGIRRFVQRENVKWICPHCGAMLCMHKPECESCGHRWHE